jgi:TetR/AcrR family transcriptional regulator, regulator of biofilm formation and stress response
VTGPTTDGRRLKGERRRRAVMDAVIRVIGRAGVSGVSQRVVAGEAGVPPSAVAYYFPTVDDLLHAVMVDVNDAWIAELERCGSDPDPLGALAALIVRAGDVARSETAAEFELFLLAGTGERWRQEYQRWTDALTAFVSRFAADDARRDLMAAAVDGLLLDTFCLSGAYTTERVRTILQVAAD